MEKVVITGFAIDKLETLIDTLYEKGYFGFYTEAQHVVSKIIDFIYTVPVQRKRPTINSKYGKFYCRYKANDNTTYYVCFDAVDELYIVKNIINNHTWEYPYYIKSE
jgi:hypothetical protein